MSEWKQHVVQQTVEGVRTGWPGVWDALVSAVTGKPIRTFARPVTVTFWGKGVADAMIAQAQMEVKK